VYSTAVSIQNMAPRWDRRVLTLLIGTLTVVVALTLDINAYTNFLYLIGAVFIPLTGALIACWLRLRGHAWNTESNAPLRPAMLAAWAAGFVVYQLVNPGAIPHWSDFWTTAGTDLHTLGHPWLSASLAAFAVALLVALPFAGPSTAPPIEPARAARAEG
jgi:purine-cytosine permease-like protein